MVLVFGIVNLSLAPIKKVFLGDAGSLLFGFLMSWILIYFSQPPVDLLHPIVALWCVAMPVFDSLIVITLRLREGRSPFSSDRLHFHHVLIDSGMNSWVALVAILAVSITITFIGIWITYTFSPIIGLIGYLGVFLACWLFYFSYCRLRRFGP